MTSDEYLVAELARAREAAETWRARYTELARLPRTAPIPGGAITEPLPWEEP
jgi:hypothetical protein